MPLTKLPIMYALEWDIVANTNGIERAQQTVYVQRGFNSNKFSFNAMRHLNQNLWVPSGGKAVCWGRFVYTLLKY